LFCRHTAAFTIDVIASTAFGVDVDASSNSDHPFVYHSKPFFGLAKSEQSFIKSLQIIRVILIGKQYYYLTND